MRCPHCQFENTAETRFCGNCAALLQPGSGSQTMTAPVLCGEIVPGTEFAGRYRILDELGRGGMGRVYKALDREITEAIALKVLVPAFSADEKMIERFRNELKLARRISHKNVCRIFDLGNCEGIYYHHHGIRPGRQSQEHHPDDGASRPAPGPGGRRPGL